MRQASAPKISARSDSAARTEGKTESALSVAVVYQDPLTHYWATELWDRVGQLIGNGDVSRESWRLSDLAMPGVFAEAVKLAAEADVLVVSLRDAAELPPNLSAWVEAWVPRRAGRGGALVALIGVPTQPNAQSGRAHRFLESVARRAGMDFLPRERKLPDELAASANPANSSTAANLAAVVPGAEVGRGPDAQLPWQLSE